MARGLFRCYFLERRLRRPNMLGRLLVQPGQESFYRLAFRTLHDRYGIPTEKMSETIRAWTH
jgi:hypothetical protein